MYNKNMEKVKVGLALGSGGLCGVSHIGFLQVLEENNIKIDMISGISMGAIVGGLYASGYSLKDLEKIALNINKKDIIGINLFKIFKESLVGSKKIENFLNTLAQDKKIEDSKIKFYAQATNLKTGKLHTFEKGSLVEALRATSAMPGIMPPVKKDDTYYVDGGVACTVPFKILNKKGADVIIAVNCLNEYGLDELPKGSINTFMSSYDCTQYLYWKLDKETNKDKYDLYCFDNTKGVNPLSLDSKNIKKLIESGRQSALKYLDEIKEIISKKQEKLDKTLEI